MQDVGINGHVSFDYISTGEVDSTLLVLRVHLKAEICKKKM